MFVGTVCNLHLFNKLKFLSEKKNWISVPNADRCFDAVSLVCAVTET